MFYWDSPDPAGTAEASMYLNNGEGEIFLCRKLIQGGTNGQAGCQGELELDLSQIDPELASKVSRLANANEKLAKELEGLRSNYAALKAFMAALEKRVDQLGASLFDVLTEADFIGHEQELKEIIELIRSYKASANALSEESKKTLEGAKAEANAVKKAFENVIAREGATIDDVTVAVPEVTDLEVDIPQPEDQTDPFDPANDPYAQIAKATIDLIERNWPDKRFEILLIINAWNQKQKDVSASLAARSRISAAEMTAYYESVKTVKTFILETGCGGNGCLSEDGWFKDSMVPNEVRRSLKAELRMIDPVKSELLEEQMRLWKRDEVNQQKIIAAVQALAGAARTLTRLAADDSAYLRGRLDAILSSTLVAAKNGACIAGTMAPGVNDFADWYELISAKNLCTGETLALWEQALSGVGIIAGSGRLWRAIGEEISGISKVSSNAVAIVSNSRNISDESLRKASKIGSESKSFSRAMDSVASGKPHFYLKRSGEAIPSTGFRHVPSDAAYLNSMVKSGSIPARADGTYFSFDSFNDAATAKTKLQVPHDAAIKVEFDTLQIVDDVRIPNGDWGRKDWLEPITKDQPQFGVGGATQAITSKEILASRIIDLRTGKVLYERK
jgi:Pre-toxin TG